MRPQRIQLSRAKGWRLPANAINVARPTMWGNPYDVDVYGRALALKLFQRSAEGGWSPAIVAELDDTLAARA